MNSVTGPRLAATLARRGGLGVLPQDMHAAGARRRDPLGEGRSRSRCDTRSSLAAARRPSPTALRLLPAARGPRHRRPRRRRRLPRVHPGRATRDRAARRPARRPRSHGPSPSIDADDVDGPARRVRPHGRRGPRVRARAAPRRSRRHAEPHERPALDALRARASMPRPPARRRRDRHQRRRRGARRRRSSRRASTCSCIDTAHGHQEGMLARHRDRRGARPRRADRRGQRRDRRGRARPRRARARHPQGRRRPRRDVHDAHDDGGRSPAVLGRARDRARPRASSARTSGPTAECATRATSPSRSPRARHPS